jgi:hypothetical protein
VLAARLVPGGTKTTQSTYAPPGASEKLLHCCSVVPVGRGPGGGGCGWAGGGVVVCEPPGVMATTVVPVHTPEAHFWRTTMIRGVVVGLAYTEVYEQPPQPGVDVFIARLFPYVPITSSSVFPVHTALGMPTEGQVEAAKVLFGGTVITQSK